MILGCFRGLKEQAVLNSVANDISDKCHTKPHPAMQAPGGNSAEVRTNVTARSKPCAVAQHKTTYYQAHQQFRRNTVGYR